VLRLNSSVSRPGLTRLRQGFSGNDFEQQHQLQAVPEVLLYVLDLGAGLAQVRVDPCREGLKGRTKG
jgi:hypothetical protein